MQIQSKQLYWLQNCRQAFNQLNHQMEPELQKRTWHKKIPLKLAK